MVSRSISDILVGGRRHHLAGAQVEARHVQWTFDLAAFDEAVRQQRELVGADVVDGIVGVGDAEQPDRTAGQRDRLGLGRTEILGAGDAVPFDGLRVGHDLSLPFETVRPWARHGAGRRHDKSTGRQNKPKPVEPAAAPQSVAGMAYRVADKWLSSGPRRHPVEGHDLWPSQRTHRGIGPGRSPTGRSAIGWRLAPSPG